MSRRGRSGSAKRKRSWDIEYASFPGDTPLQCRKAGLRTVGAAASLSEAWLRCGEGFQETAGTPSLTAEKKTNTEEHLELSSRHKKEPTTSEGTSGITAITWSSSESDLSDEDKNFKPRRDSRHGCRIDRFDNRNILCPQDGTSEDDLQLIDWEIDSDKEDPCECDEFEDCESAVEISDGASCASSSSLTPAEMLPELPKTSPTEILEYSSDSERADDSENVLFTDAEPSHRCPMGRGPGGRQAAEKLVNLGLRPAETIVHAPPRQTKLPKTPEKSAKTKKLLRGGLAERLNGLQNRERSAISLWRHQCVSYQRTSSGRKSGVLAVKILELHEECTIQVAMCEQLSGLQADSPSQGGAARTSLKVLFTKETARCLRGRPQDIVHIYPPWQKLIVPNGSCPVILNTYFCQKVVAKEDSKTAREAHGRDTPLPKRSITLAQTFKFKSLTSNSPESQVIGGGLSAEGTGEAEQHVPTRAPLRDSLLDAVESQGAATWSGAGVRVVVQRVYSLPCRCQQAGGEDPPGAGVCLLVQDACGLFGEVHLVGMALKDRALEGKSCRLAGLKVLRKATRGRMAGLFSLIDTMWPPVVPLRAPGRSSACEEETTHLPPPSFCYILSAHPNLGQIDVIDEDPVSKFYQPPVPRFLREILQTDGLCTRCSFYARVIYQGPQVNSLEPRELWLVVTDVTLQMQRGDNSGLPRTMPVCVAPSCVLGPEVQDALSEAASQSFLFRDALLDQGRIVCIGRTVLLLPKPHLGVASDAWEPPGPVRLDALDSVTRVNSICSVQEQPYNWEDPVIPPAGETTIESNPSRETGLRDRDRNSAAKQDDQRVTSGNIAQGTVTGVDESTAFSWPACDLCGSARLEQSPGDRGTFFCGDCSRLVTSPLLRRHLQVFLDCPSRPQCTVRVQLLQDSISSLLKFAASEDGSYEVKSVLGKEVGPLTCFVRSLTTHPTSCVGLEEVELLSEGRASSEDWPRPQDL